MQGDLNCVRQMRTLRAGSVAVKAAAAIRDRVFSELLEPREDQFDFALVDSLIADARRNEMHLVLLWFGSWKNSMSSYVPEYVKTNQARFPRTEATR
jgi:beta-galactosidase GanA